MVVDNASTDGSQEWLTSQGHITSYCLDNNKGGSFGFTYGMEKALENNADWIWTMDEDVIVDPTCLEHMMTLAKSNPDVDYWCPNVVMPDNKINLNSLPETNTNLDLITSTFIGTLQRASSLETFGLPISNMFRFYDDIEFYWRIGKQGARGRMALKAQLTHFSTGKKESEYLKDLHTDKWAPLYFQNQYYYLGKKNGRLNQLKKLMCDIAHATNINKSLIDNTLTLIRAYIKSLLFKPVYGTK